MSHDPNKTYPFPAVRSEKYGTVLYRVPGTRADEPLNEREVEQLGKAIPATVNYFSHRFLPKNGIRITITLEAL